MLLPSGTLCQNLTPPPSLPPAFPERSPFPPSLLPSSQTLAPPSLLTPPLRIEIEGGSEIPILDGSALGWTLDVQV